MSSARSITKGERILGGLWGSIVGDALGVPVEFLNRDEVATDPVKDMRGNGTHHQPAGTWSDDSSLLLCSVDSLVSHEFDLEDMGKRFLAWYREEIWTPHGDVFDAGAITTDALGRIAAGVPAEQAGGRDEFSNGNGSLMRIIPLALRFADEPIGLFARRLERGSAITHGHERSKMACAFHGLLVRQLMFGLDCQQALDSARAEFKTLYSGSHEIDRFHRHLNNDFCSIAECEIVSTGYVLDTLRASLWCLLTSANYKECVLKAVNLGGDTDTTGCVAGGLAGVAYGNGSIPAEWISQLARKDDLERLFHKFASLSDET